MRPLRTLLGIGPRLRRLYLGFRHPDTPLWAKGLALLVLAYGISPLDLVPDVIPLFGWLDDLTLFAWLIWGWESCLPAKVRQAIAQQTQSK
ncbi:YkvA family protein [Aeromonas sobria]|uniref:YkvA family protein n=1 Tax=Aeromonas sobria TaxID=646 RepID=UPI003CFE4A30